MCSAARLDAAGHGKPTPQPGPIDSDSESTRDSEISQKPSPSKWRLVFSAFLPFAAGYYLAYLFRTINAAISPALASDFGIDAAEVGLLASVYFLVFGLAQIPIGVFLDRLGPRRVQGVLLVIAAGGATLFGTASSFPELLVARAMIGLGVAGSLMAGLKAVVTWFPKERVALMNGWMIMLGSLGAVTATAPTDWLLELVGWRGLFEVLTIGTVAVAGLIYMVVPERAEDSEVVTSAQNPLTLWSVYSDPQFLRVAPLSAACIGSSWALQSLWAAAWLTDVEGYDQQIRVHQMFLMAVVLSFGALLVGALADRLRKYNIRTEILLAGVGALFAVAELALIFRLPLPSLLPWSMVSIAGAATVLSFAAIADYFPKAICRARQWRYQRLTLRLGVLGSIRHWGCGRTMAVSGRALSGSRLSGRIRSHRCTSNSRFGMVCDAVDTYVRQKSLPSVLSASQGRRRLGRIRTTSLRAAHF